MVTAGPGQHLFVARLELRATDPLDVLTPDIRPPGVRRHVLIALHSMRKIGSTQRILPLSPRTCAPLVFAPGTGMITGRHAPRTT